MKIPVDAIIPREKLTKYLLVFQPESDKSRFLAQAGFTQRNPDALEAAIRALIVEYDAVKDDENLYGRFYKVEGELRAAHGRNLPVVTVWISRAGEDGIYRFVTLKPWR